MNNRELIERYYRHHRDELLAYVSSRLGGSDFAEDIVQDAFLRLLSIREPVIEATLPNLAFTFCRRLVIDWYRRRTLHADVKHELQRTTVGTASAESVLSVRDITERLERGLARLPEECRELYRLHIYDGMKTSDISQLTGENYRTVEYRLGLARKHIRNYLRHVS